MTDTPRCHICNKTESHTDEHGQTTKEILGSCASCHRLFCTEHTSNFDNSLCSVCVNINNTIIDSKPLTDDDGVSHKGRQLILTGESWMRSRDVICMMTDQELEAKLSTMKQAVHEAEMILDYRRIIHNQLENEKSGRLSKKLSRLRLISAVDHVHKNSQTPSQAVQAKKNDNLKEALGALSKMGLNKDAVTNLLIRLAQQKKEK